MQTAIFFLALSMTFIVIYGLAVFARGSYFSGKAFRYYAGSDIILWTILFYLKNK